MLKIIHPKQDLHIHTTFSTKDSSVVPEQTIELVASVRHAEIIGISDHFEHLTDGLFEMYCNKVREYGLLLGIEVNGGDYAREAISTPVDYFIYHCRDRDEDYRGVDILLESGKPVIIAHPYFLGTNLNRISRRCIIEINNRYIWRIDWKKELQPFVGRFRFILSSDAHQPNWLSLNVAYHVACSLGIEETVLF